MAVEWVKTKEDAIMTSWELNLGYFYLSITRFSGDDRYITYMDSSKIGPFHKTFEEAKLFADEFLKGELETLKDSMTKIKMYLFSGSDLMED
jgi:hypothetical protein